MVPMTHSMVTVHAKVDKIEAKRVALRTRSGLIWLPRDKVVCSKHSQVVQMPIELAPCLTWWRADMVLPLIVVDRFQVQLVISSAEAALSKHMRGQQSMP
jgi:hypothetical protein